MDTATTAASKDVEKSEVQSEDKSVGTGGIKSDGPEEKMDTGSSAEVEKTATDEGKKEEGKKEEEVGEVDKGEGEKEKKAPEPDFENIANPARVLPQQVRTHTCTHAPKVGACYENFPVFLSAKGSELG